MMNAARPINWSASSPLHPPRWVWCSTPFTICDLRFTCPLASRRSAGSRNSDPALKRRAILVSPSGTSSLQIRISRLLLLLGALALAGCATPGSWPVGWAPSSEYKLHNVYRPTQHVPPHIRRVAVLPISAEPGDWQADHGRGELQSLLLSEMGRAQRFELVFASPELLVQLTGRDSWRADERLPHDFCQQLQAALECDAILLSHLRPYHAYKPLVIGWNVKLLDLHSQLIVWSVDEVFDASEPVVAKAARHYHQTQGFRWGAAEDTMVLASPRRFGQFTLNAVFDTLPPRLGE
jgi:hypothetical protein